MVLNPTLLYRCVTLCLNVNPHLLKKCDEGPNFIDSRVTVSRYIGFLVSLVYVLAVRQDGSCAMQLRD